jgi:hypothetical protein
MSALSTWLLATALAVLVALVLPIAIRRWHNRWRRRRQWAKALAAEADAPAFLEQHGYALVGAQVAGSYCLSVDGKPMVVELRADYVVARDGKTYIAEVKSGGSAPRLNNPATRRQLLEYRVAFEVDGVLLVDGETQQVHEVTFPLPDRHPAVASRAQYLELYIAIGFLLVVLVVLAIR